MIIAAISTVFEIKVQECEIDEVILVDFYQPLAVLTICIIHRIFSRMNRAGVCYKFTATFDRNALVTRFEASTGVRRVRVKLYEHFVPGTSVDQRLVRVANLPQFWHVLVFAVVNLDFIEDT